MEEGEEEVRVETEEGFSVEVVISAEMQEEEEEERVEEDMEDTKSPKAHSKANPFELKVAFLEPGQIVALIA